MVSSGHADRKFRNAEQGTRWQRKKGEFPNSPESWRRSQQSQEGQLERNLERHKRLYLQNNVKGKETKKRTRN